VRGTQPTEEALKSTNESNKNKTTTADSEETQPTATKHKTNLTKNETTRAIQI
jgi:hypothetical protein